MQQKQQLIQQQKLLKPSEVLANTECKWIVGELSNGKGKFCALGALQHELLKLGKTDANFAKEFGVTRLSVWPNIVMLNNSSPTHSYKECIEYLQSIGL